MPEYRSVEVLMIRKSAFRHFGTSALYSYFLCDWMYPNRLFSSPFSKRGHEIACSRIADCIKGVWFHIAATISMAVFAFWLTERSGPVP